jgi:hypothetical protein
MEKQIFLPSETKVKVGRWILTLHLSNDANESIFPIPITMLRGILYRL